MLHTFVAETTEAVMRVARPAFKNYLAEWMDLEALARSTEGNDRLNH